MRKLKVLIVDDSLVDVMKTAALLESKGHKVISATNGKAGIDLASKERPDLILMDLVMPELNGFQATRQLSKTEATKDIPVIVISGKDQETDKVWAMRQGAKAYLTKEVDQHALFTAISNVMGLRV